MALDQYARTALVLGEENVKKLRQAHVAVFGLGGVGGYVVEALARSGIGTLDIIDNDRVSLTNLNRQVLALRSTLGQYKADVAQAHIHDIDPEIKVNKHICFFLPDTQDQFDFSAWDYVVDAIDTVTGKLGIIQMANAAGVPVISCMGCGNRTDPGQVQITDLYKTVNDPLAKIMRRECRKRGIRKLSVVYSTQPAIRPVRAPGEAEEEDHKAGEKRAPRRDTPGSTAFVPAAAGILAASKVVMDLTGFDGRDRTKTALNSKAERFE